jgi:hypothetical protein
MEIDESEMLNLGGRSADPYLSPLFPPNYYFSRQENYAITTHEGE